MCNTCHDQLWQVIFYQGPPRTPPRWRPARTGLRPRPGLATPAQLQRKRRERHPVPPARRRNRRSHSRTVVCGMPARCAAVRAPHRPPATSSITPPTASATSSHPASTNAGSKAWVTRQRADRASARRSSGSGPPPGHNASSRTGTPLACRTTGSPGAAPPPGAQPRGGAADLSRFTYPRPVMLDASAKICGLAWPGGRRKPCLGGPRRGGRSAGPPRTWTARRPRRPPGAAPSPG